MRLVAFGAIACAPTVLWFARNYFTTHHAHDRPFQPRGLGVDQLRAAVDAVSLWLLPNWFELRVRAVWLVLMVVLAVLAVRRLPKAQRASDATRDAFRILVGLCVAAYLGFVLVTMLFFDFEVNFDVRMMSPVLVLLVIAGAVGGSSLFARPWSSTAKALASVLIVSFTLLAGYTAVHAWSARRDPAQFASARWTQSSAWDVVKSYPAATPIYSSQTEVSEYFRRPRCAAARDGARSTVPPCSCTTRRWTVRTNP